MGIKIEQESGELTSTQLMGNIAWYFGIPLFTGLLTYDFKWAVLAFIAVSMIMVQVKSTPKKPNQGKL